MKSVDLTPNGKPKRSFLSLLRSLSGVLLIVGGLSVLLWTVGSRLTSAPSSPQEKTRREKEVVVKSENARKTQESVELGNLPDYIRQASQRVQEAYQFAGAQPNILKDLSCYCGCKDRIHQNLLDCFFKKISKDGVVYENHGVNCGICLGEALDAKRWLAEGKNLPEISQLINQKYQN